MNEKKTLSPDLTLQPQQFHIHLPINDTFLLFFPADAANHNQSLHNKSLLRKIGQRKWPTLYQNYVKGATPVPQKDFQKQFGFLSMFHL